MSEQVVLPQILAKPSATGGPVPPRTINRCGRAPQVGVMMSHPTARTPMHLRRSCSGLGQLLHHSEQRFHTFAEVTSLGRPIVHFRVDVNRIFAAPGRVQPVRPEPLQVGRLTAWPRTGEQQVAPELKVQSR
jgi:hypothetical protein